MKKMRITLLPILIIGLLLPFSWGQQTLAPEEYTVVCTFSESSKEYRTYRVDVDGQIYFINQQNLISAPYLIRFAPNGKWGIIGCWVYPDPATHYSVLIRIDKMRNILIWDYLYNKYLSGEGSIFASISPDSTIGCYGNVINTVRVSRDCMSHDIQYNINIPVVWYDFLSPTKILAQTDWNILSEFSVSADGVTTPTGAIVNIYPSTANRGIRVSPDGKTAIVISGVGADVTVIRVNGDSDFSVVQQFNPGINNYNPGAVHFSPDSRYAAIRFSSFICIYSIANDSRLTEISRAIIPQVNGNASMGVSHDFRIAVAGDRMLVNGVHKTFFFVYRIHENGMIEYLPDKDYVCQGMFTDIAFVPPQVTDAEPAWDRYE